MATTTVQTMTLASADEEKALSVLTLAFSTDPVLRWVFPAPQDYLRYFPELLRAFAGKAFLHGTAYYVGEDVGAALWLQPGAHLDEEALGGLLERALPNERQGEVFAVLEQMGTYHPAEPHWYLPVIGIDPIQQGKGYGSALMRHVLERIDREHKQAYLESSNPRNNPLYERLGFEELGTIQEGDSPPLWPMVRRAR